MRPRHLLWIACLASIVPVFGQTVISPGANVQAAVNDAAPGSTLALNAGTYSMPGTLVINKSITIVSNTPGQRPVLQFPSGTVVGVDIKASNVRLESLRIAGPMWGVYAGNPSAEYSNITIRNVAVAAVTGPNPGHGLYFTNVTNAVADSNIIESAPVTGILLDNTSHNGVVINNNVSANAHGIAITRSDSAIMAGNTITRAGDFGIILQGSRFSRVERNTITAGVSQDGIVVTRDDASNTLSQSNYVGRNVVTSTGFTSNNPAGTGIWLNSQSNGTLVYANTTSGTPENGLSIFNTSNAWLWGNDTSRNGHGGIFVHGPTLSYSVGPAPNNNFVQGNYAHDLTANAGLNLHTTTNNTVFNNAVRNAPAGIFLQNTSGNRLFLNILHNTQQGLHVLGGTTGSTYFLNRHVTAMPNYRDPGATVEADGGPVFGGNFQAGGKVLDDSYPYNNEQLSKPPSVNVTLPVAGAIVAAGTRKTIEWRSTACTYVDIVLLTSAGAMVARIADNYPDTGVFQWDVSTVAAGTYMVQVQCNNSSGATLSTNANSGAFTIAPAGLELLSPQGNNRVNGGSATTVSWRRTGSATGPVTVQYRPSPGAALTTLASNITDTETQVTVPAGGSPNAMFIVRIDGSSVADSSDGFVNVTDTTPVVTLPAGTLPIGTLQLAQWNSHPNSFYVDIEYWDTTASMYRPLVTNLPDFGRFYFLVPDKAMVGTHLRVRFKTSALAAITTANSGTFSTAVNTSPDSGPPASAPNVVRSITPTSGTSASQTFSIIYSDPNGGNDIATTQLLLNSADGNTACRIEYTRATNALRVVAGSGFCSLGSGGSGAVSGNNLTVNYPVTFQTSGAGTYTTLAAATDAGGLSSGPQTIGTWTVPGATTTPAPSAPQVVSLTPTTGSGNTGTFTAVFRHSGGLNKHYLGYILFLPLPNVVSFQAQGSCLIEYNRISNGMRLINNAGDNWIGPPEGVRVAPSTPPLSNNACTVNVAQSSATLAGADMTVRVNVTFNPAVLTTVLGTFIQEQDVDGKWTDFRQFGNWVLPGAPQRPGPYVVASSPISGTGSSMSLATTVGHTGGVNSLGEVHLRFSSMIVGAPACHVVYFSTNNTIAIVNDAGNALMGPVALGQPINAGRCSMAAGATRSLDTNTLTLNLPLTFNSTSFGGAQNLYVNAFDRAGALTHWVQTGTWSVQ
jgi:parallel beta-helix repeat protein